MVIVCPVPSIVRVSGLGIVGSALLSVIVPLRLKLIMSVPVPLETHPLTVPLLLDALIASRKEQTPAPPGLGSAVVLTIIGPLAFSEG